MNKKELQKKYSCVPIKQQSNRVWRSYTGGKNLDILAGKRNPSDSHFPEDWIASLTQAVNPGREHLPEEGLSTVVLEGKCVLLKKLIEQNPEEMLGKAHFNKYGASTAFLLKFLDSNIRLHIQCHPTVDFAKKFLNSSYGKTEGYYILGVRDDVETPYIYLGFQNPPSEKELKRAIALQDIPFLESCFEKIPLKKNDAFLVPGGLPHAIGPGIFMIEIMEPSDFVVRIEFEKAGYTLPEKARFMDRGIDFALSMFNYKALSVNTIREKYFIRPQPTIEEDNFKEYAIFDKTNTGCFRLSRLEIKGMASVKRDSFYIAIIINGEGAIETEHERIPARFGDKFFIPASTTEVRFITGTELIIILALPPE